MIFVIPRNIYLAAGMSQKQVLDKCWLNLIKYFFHHIYIFTLSFLIMLRKALSAIGAKWSNSKEMDKTFCLEGTEKREKLFYILKLYYI